MVGTGRDSGEPTRWGWEAALKAVIYFLRPEGLLPQGVWIQSMPRGPAPQREPMGLCLSVFDYLIKASAFMRTFRSDVSLFRSRPHRPQILLRGERD
jgi:hypothetical protein